MASRNKFVCVRCLVQLPGTRTYSKHIEACTHEITIDNIHTMLGVTRGPGCWEVGSDFAYRYIPKITAEPRTQVGAHILICTIHRGERPEGLHILHSCDNNRCLNPEHLSWGTPQENALDAWRNKKRVMSPEQNEKMQEARRHSEKNKARMLEHNRNLAEVNSGDSHWTRRDPIKMQRWKEAIAAGRAKKAHEGGGAQ